MNEPGFLSATAQRVLKAFHVLFAGVWLGALAAIVLLEALGPVELDARTFGLDLAAYRIHETLLFGAFVGTLATGVLFSLFTKWGFFEHHWITVKWALASVLFAVTLWLQSPAVAGVVALSDLGLPAMHGHRYVDYRASSFHMALAQLSIVVIVFVVSTLKPWGRRKKLRTHRGPLVLGMSVVTLVCVAFAVFNFVSLANYRNMEIARVDVSAFPDGLYQGQADCGFVYAVDVGVESGHIVRAVAVRNRDTHYAQIAEGVLTRVVREQRTDVDAVTGATTTSRCLTKAAENALWSRPSADAGGGVSSH